ncbi:MAG: acylphosphatase [archaeon GB-1867-035]|nr:acylphosphatase [Candidatus Culexmicrobium profundum]
MKPNNPQTQALQITVTGKVQRVGYRRHILDLAQELNLNGYIKNQPDGSVQIFIQGPKEKLQEFIKRIRKPPLGKVETIQIKEAKTNPKIKTFKIIYGELAEELQEGFGAMQTVFLEYWNEFRDYRKEFRNYREEFKNYREEFRDYRNEFRSFVKRTEEKFNTILNKYGEISEKLTVILETLVRESKETRQTLNQTMKLLKQAIEKLSK